MNSVFQRLAKQENAWCSETLGHPNGQPVSVRVMEKVAASFHTHQQADEFFLVLSGEVFIDLDEESILLRQGESYTVTAGTRHRARVNQRAELVVVGGLDQPT